MHVGSSSKEPFLYLVAVIEISYLGGVEERTDRSRMGGRSVRWAEEWTVYVPARRKTHFKPGRVLKSALCEPQSES